MRCPTRGCWGSLSPNDPQWTRKVAKEQIEGAVEFWICTECFMVYDSEMVRGVRVMTTPVEVYDEVELPA